MFSKSHAKSAANKDLSKTDRQIIACDNTFQIYKNFIVVKDAIAYVSFLIESSKERTVSKNRLQQIQKITKQSSVVIDILSNNILQQLDALTTVAYMQDVMRRMDLDIKRFKTNSSSSVSPPVKLKKLHDILVSTSGRSDNISPRKQVSTVPAPTTILSSEPRYSRRVINNKKTNLVPSYPLPMDRRMYGTAEFVSTYLSLESYKGITIKEWYAKGYIPVCPRQAVRYVTEFRKSGEVKPTWNMRGRERLVSSHIAYDSYKTQMGGTSTCVSKNYIGDLLRKAKSNRAKEKGILLLGSKGDVDKTTIERYHKEIAIKTVLNGEASIVMNPKDQSDHRHAAEQSLRSCTSFIMTVLCTHFLPKSECPNSFFETNKHLLAVGAQTAIGLVEKSLGYNVVPIDPAYLTSTDDTSLYITNDVIERRFGTDWHVISKEGAGKRKFRNTKQVGGKKDPNHGGFRVKLCFTISASGQMADLVVIINGLNPGELPMTDDEMKQCRGIRVLEIPGLTPGSTLNPQNKETGFLVFCRGNIEGVDCARHEWYDRIVFERFVKNLREERSEMNEVESPIFRSWRDGDFSQINALPMQYVKQRWEEDKIGYNKQSANRSGTEQSADLWDCFKFLKRKANSTTMKGKPDTIIMHRVRKYLKQNKLSLKGKHESCLLSFLGRLPEIMGRIANRTNIKEAFMRNGMIDKETGTCPDIYEMLNTLPGTLSTRCHDLIFENFDELLSIQQAKGRIYDEDYQRMGFPKDKYFDGTEFERKSVYAPRLRAFDMSYDFYLQYQQKIMLDMKKVEYQKLVDIFKKGEQVTKNARACEEIVIGNMRKDRLENCDISHSELKHFASNTCTAEKLKDFIKVRSWPDLNSNGAYFKTFGIGNKFPNRMKLTEALAGTDCLIKRAFDVRLNSMIMIPPAEPNYNFLLPDELTPWQGPTLHRT